MAARRLRGIELRDANHSCDMHVMAPHDGKYDAPASPMSFDTLATPAAQDEGCWRVPSAFNGCGRLNVLILSSARQSACRRTQRLNARTPRTNPLTNLGLYAYVFPPSPPERHAQVGLAGEGGARRCGGIDRLPTPGAQPENRRISVRLPSEAVSYS
jgi:hypothetical protein